MEQRDALERGVSLRPDQLVLLSVEAVAVLLQRHPRLQPALSRPLLLTSSTGAKTECASRQNRSRLGIGTPNPSNEVVLTRKSEPIPNDHHDVKYAIPLVSPTNMLDPTRLFHAGARYRLYVPGGVCGQRRPPDPPALSPHTKSGPAPSRVSGRSSSMVATARFTRTCPTVGAHGEHQSVCHRMAATQYCRG